ncbi:hypothetical protein HY991_04680 [Candidatus Micrarchaeota archaeon]|nr:hypothetical protein [Candidatus Micrarchaeota archaeon]
MTETIKVRITGMQCGSCERLISSKVAQVQGVSIRSISSARGEMIADVESVDARQQVIAAVNAAGYGATFEPLHSNAATMETTAQNEQADSPVAARAKDDDLVTLKYAYPTKDSLLTQSRSETTPIHKHHGRMGKVEKNLIANAALTLVAIGTLEGIAYLAFFRSVEGFFSRRMPFLLYMAVSVVANASAVAHLRTYSKALPCMTGMMIGMTLGMTAGFMLGAVTGATNGMFVGSVVGMLAGMVVGSYGGKCAGVMGIMEGLMAGVMGGTMGAMTSVMMINDNLLWFMPLLIGSFVVILLGLGYLVYKENNFVGEKAKIAGEFELLPFFSVCFILTIMMTLLMVYGPKSYLVA